MATVTLIDGEIGTELTKYVGDSVDNDPLWSCRYNVTRPDIVYQCYMNFLRTNCDLIRTNTYQASVAGFKEHLQLTRDEDVARIFHDAIQLAFDARDNYLSEENKEERRCRPIEVWASLGSYGAYRGDGSEYNGKFLDMVSAAAVKEFHRERLELVLREPVNGLAFETIPSQREAEMVVDLMNELYPNVKFWISFNCMVSER